MYRAYAVELQQVNVSVEGWMFLMIVRMRVYNL